MSVSQISGLVSGLDTAALINAMVTARSAPVLHLQRRQAEKTAELSAWQSFDAVLLSLKIETERLGNRDLWSKLIVTASDEDHVTATADATASLGTFDLFVEQLAAAHQVQSDAFSSRDELVGSGTFSLTIDGSANDLTVAAGATVSDLAQQINDADLDVTASLIRSETLGNETFHMVITADETGASSQFTVDPSGLTGGTAPDFTTSTPRLGADAIVRFGGENGLAVHSSTNRFTDALDGVDITVRQVHATGESTQVGIERDTEGLQSNIREFVDRFNAMVSFTNSQYRFDPEVGGRPALMGDSTLTSVTGQVRSALLGPVAGLADAPFSTLSGIGLTSGASGSLSFDESKFAEALKDDFGAVANLFRANASYDANGLEWLTAPAGVDLENRSIEVIISQAAERAGVIGTTIDLGSGLVIDATNDTFEISLDGIRSESVTLAHGTYTDGDLLAQAMVNAVSSSDDLGGLGVRAAWVQGTGSSGQLSLSSTKYGNAASIQFHNAGGNFGADLGLTSVMGVKFSGADVIGTINGITATGRGRVLKLDDDVEDLGGLSFRVTAEAGDVPTTITAQFTDGVGRSTTRRLTSITDATDGTLARLESSIQRTLKRYERDILAKQDQLEQRRARLERRFAALEATLGRLQSQSQFVSAQIDAAAANR